MRQPIGLQTGLADFLWLQELKDSVFADTDILTDFLKMALYCFFRDPKRMSLKNLNRLNKENLWQGEEEEEKGQVINGELRPGH